jgi:argininosuccinate lyase
MSQPVWKARTAKEPDPLVIALCAGRDMAEVPPADAALIPHDIHLNMAHALMLARVKIISPENLRRLLRGLRTLRRRAEEGKFTLDPAAEDVHINVEQALTHLAGSDAAGRLHTARSRNDQAATDMRLWLRERLAESMDQILELAKALAKRARREAEVVCPGFTHMQPAQVTSLGHLWAAHAHALERDLNALLACTDAVDTCPLGAAASFGTPWPIDREWVAEILGFEIPAENTLDAIANRWEAEARVAQAWALTLTHLSTLAADVIWLSTPPRDWVRLDDAHVTGSSIMPQKRNPDIAEVTRARAAACQAAAQAIVATATGQLSGYNRDLQWTKCHIMDAWRQIDQVPEAWRRVIEGLTIDRPAMRAACRVGFLEAAEVADYLSRATGQPFRRLHHVLGRAVERCDAVGRLTLGALNGALIDAGVKYQLSLEEWDQIQDPTLRLTWRSHVGSPSTERVRESVSALLAHLRSAHGSLKSWRRGHERAQRKMDRLVVQMTRPRSKK